MIKLTQEYVKELFDYKARYEEEIKYDFYICDNNSSAHQYIQRNKNEFC